MLRVWKISEDQVNIVYFAIIGFNFGLQTLPHSPLQPLNLETPLCCNQPCADCAFPKLPSHLLRRLPSAAVEQALRTNQRETLALCHGSPPADRLGAL